MKEWQLKELELQRKENAWFDELPEWMKVIDNHFYFVLVLLLILPISFGIGLGIGLLL